MTWKAGDTVTLKVRFFTAQGAPATFASWAAAAAAGWTQVLYQGTAVSANQVTPTLVPNPDGDPGDHLFSATLPPSGAYVLKFRNPANAFYPAEPEAYQLIVPGQDLDAMFSFLSTAVGTPVSADRVSQYDWDFTDGDTFQKDMFVPASALADFGYTSLADLSGGAWTVTAQMRKPLNPPPAAADFTLVASVIDKPTSKIRIQLPDGLANEIDYTQGNTQPYQYDVQVVGTLALAVTGVSIGAKTFTVAGDQRYLFGANKVFTISGSTGNNGSWTVASSTLTGGNTVVTVTGTPGSATADGTIAVTFKITVIRGTITCRRQETTVP